MILSINIFYAGVIPRIHSHGNIRGLLDEFVRSGTECIDPIEPPPDGNITLAEVKKGWGDKLVLMGNIELRDLETSDPEHIRQLVKQAMDDAKEGGGFILYPCSVPLDAELKPKTEENIIAMLDAGLEFGRYE